MAAFVGNTLETQTRNIFNQKYEEDLVMQLQQVIRSATELELSKTSLRKKQTPHEHDHERSNNHNADGNHLELSSSPAPMEDLQKYKLQCDHVDTIRRIKNDLDRIALTINRDIDRLDEPAAKALKPRKRLDEKQFTTCNSMLTDLLEVRHFRTIYNIFVVILLMLLLNTLVHDYVADGSVNVGLVPISIGLGRFHLAVVVWLVMQTMSTMLFGMFMLWAKVRELLKKNEVDVKIWDNACLIAFVGFQFLLLGLTVRLVFVYDLPMATSIAVLMELTRFLMKNHAFVRSNAPKTYTPKPKTDGKPQSLPTFSNFVYFQFAPTLIYRDSYPRTHIIRWRRVAWNCVEVAGVVFYVSFIFERFLVPYFRMYGDKSNSMNLQSLVVAIFGSVLPATIANLCGFYCLLHAWMNGWAELLRFGDRQFYKDWWNASSYDVYYRTWNIVVHDWLYTYVYKDMYECVTDGSKVKATFVVFTLSAVFHEFILAVSFRFFYPVLLTMFLGVGMLLSCVRLKHPSSAGNIFLWFSIAFGNGLCISLYCIEYFARQNCPVDETKWTEYFVPVSWRCNGF